MKFSCNKLQLSPEPLSRGLPPPDPRSLCSLSSTEFVEIYWILPSIHNVQITVGNRQLLN